MLRTSLFITCVQWKLWMHSISTNSVNEQKIVNYNALTLNLDILCSQSWLYNAELGNRRSE